MTGSDVCSSDLVVAWIDFAMTASPARFFLASILFTIVAEISPKTIAWVVARSNWGESDTGEMAIKVAAQNGRRT